MTYKIEPRIDDIGVGWCWTDCPSIRKGPFCTYICGVTGKECTSRCLPYDRQQAVENDCFENSILELHAENAQAEKRIKELEVRASLHDGLFDAVEELFADCDPDKEHHARAGQNRQGESLDPLWRAYKLLIDDIDNQRE